MRFFFLILIALMPLISGCGRQEDGKKVHQACFKNNCFTVELAATPEERSRGLMRRENLGLDRGMLFLFEREGAHSFWMKNTLIPLDIIWLNAEQEAVYISKNTPPCKTEQCPLITPNKKALYALEINAGLADKLNLQVGDKIIWQ